jgi:hypothetical protein
MSKIFTFALSELLMYALVLGIIIIVSPTIPLGPAFIVAFIVYVFSTTLYFISEFIIGLFANNRRDLDK